jgi:vitamin B12 transporter
MNLLSWQNDIKLPVGEALLAYEYTKQNGLRQLPTTRSPSARSTRFWPAGMEISSSTGLQLSLRRDDNSQFGDQTTGSASYGYQFTPEWRAHVSYGTAFRAPTFNELYFPQKLLFSLAAIQI